MGSDPSDTPELESAGKPLMIDTRLVKNPVGEPLDDDDRLGQSDWYCARSAGLAAERHDRACLSIIRLFFVSL